MGKHFGDHMLNFLRYLNFIVGDATEQGVEQPAAAEEKLNQNNIKNLIYTIKLFNSYKTGSGFKKEIGMIDELIEGVKTQHLNMREKIEPPNIYRHNEFLIDEQMNILYNKVLGNDEENKDNKRLQPL